MTQAARADTLDDLAKRLRTRETPARLVGLRGASRAVAVAHLTRAHGDRPVLVLVATAKAGDAFVEDLQAALGETPDEGRLRVFPRYDTQPYERFSPQPFLVAQRMDVLYRWLSSPAPTPGGPKPQTDAPIVVAPWTALAPRVPTREFVRSKTVHLEVGQMIDRDALVETLVAAGYARMPLVEERGELAVRGGILDLYPPHRSLPLRIELLGDEVESIREFDPASQRSQLTLPHAVAAAAAGAAARSRAHHRPPGRAARARPRPGRPRKRRRRHDRHAAARQSAPWHRGASAPADARHRERLRLPGPTTRSSWSTICPRARRGC